MNVARFIAELRKELVRIDEVILAMERLAAEPPRKRGRPPALVSAAGHNGPDPAEFPKLCRWEPDKSDAGPASS